MAERATVSLYTVHAAPIERVRYDVRTRNLTVVRIERVTPAMLRITFGGDGLADFDSRGFDDHVEPLLPQSDGRVERRDDTPRRFDPVARTLAIDVALHDDGPASSWARRARPGDRLQITGPKGSRVVSPSVRRWLSVGDETALPAIGRLFEQAQAGTEIISCGRCHWRRRAAVVQVRWLPH